MTTDRQRVEIEFSLRDRFSRGLRSIGKDVDEIGRKMRRMGTIMAGAGLAIVASVVAMTKSFADVGDEIQKMAIRTGFSTEALSELRFAAERSGFEFNEMNAAIRRVQRTVEEARQGNQAMAENLRIIGLNVADLIALDPEGQFNAIAEAVGSLTTPAERVTAAFELFGDSGVRLLPLLEGGAEGMKALRQEARDLGLVIDQDTANQAAAFNDAMTNLKGSMGALVFEIGGQLAPALTDLALVLAGIVGEFREWADEHPTLARNVAIAGAGIAALGAALFLTGVVLPPAVAGFQLLSAAVGAVASAKFGAIALGIGSVSATALIATGQIGALTAAIVALPAVVKTTSAFMDPFMAQTLSPEAGRAFRRGGSFGDVLKAEIGNTIKTAFEKVNVFEGVDLGAPDFSEVAKGIREEMDKALGLEFGVPLKLPPGLVDTVGTNVIGSLLVSDVPPTTFSQRLAGLQHLRELREEADRLREDAEPTRQQQGGFFVDLFNAIAGSVGGLLGTDAAADSMRQLREETGLYSNLLTFVGVDAANAFRDGLLQEADAVRLVIDVTGLLQDEQERLAVSTKAAANEVIRQNERMFASMRSLAESSRSAFDIARIANLGPANLRQVNLQAQFEAGHRTGEGDPNNPQTIRRGGETFRYGPSPFRPGEMGFINVDVQIDGKSVSESQGKNLKDQ